MSLKLRDNEELKALLRRNPCLSVEGKVPVDEPEATKKTKTLCDGMLFDSPGEAARYEHLKLLQKAELIRRLSTQHEDIGKPQEQRRHRWELYPGYVRDGKKYKSVYYIDDFRYEAKINGNWIEVVEDYKGYQRALFIQKWKILRGRFPTINFFLNFEITGWYVPGSQ